jgi:hypothetical protein
MSFVEQYMGIKMQKELQQLAQLTAEQLLHLEFSQLNSKVLLLPVVSRFSLIPKVTVCRNLKFVNSPALLVRMVQVQRFLEKKILDFPSLCFLAEYLSSILVSIDFSYTEYCVRSAKT